MPVQNAIGSVPVTNVQPPPEGLMAASVQFVLTPGEPSIVQSFQLSSQGGLLLSQVVALFLDNSQNAFPIVAVHGALNETTQVPAFSTAVTPTFSGRGPFSISIGTVNGVAPTANLTVNVIFLNYPRPAGTFSATSQSTIIATGQNTTTIFAGILGFTAAGQNFNVTNAGNFVLDSLDLSVDGFDAAASGAWAIFVSVVCGGVNIAQTQPVGTAGGAGWMAGGSIHAPVQRTWPQGLILPRGGIINVSAGSGGSTFNMAQAQVRLNISGINSP